MHKIHKIHKKVSLEQNTNIAYQLTCTNTAKCAVTCFDILLLLNTGKFSSRTCSKILIAFVRIELIALVCLSACLDSANCGIVFKIVVELIVFLNCVLNIVVELIVFLNCVLNIVVELIVCLNCVLEMLDIQWRRLLVSYSCSSILCLGNIPFLQIFYNIPQIFKYSLDDPTV